MKDGKRCVICRRRQPLSEFNLKRASADGFQPHCRDCNRAACRDYYRRKRAQHLRDVTVNRWAYVARNRAVIFAHLIEHPCVDCGEADPIVLEFDHASGEKLGEVPELAARPVALARLRSEMAKCVIRCVNCHLRRTARSQGWWKLGVQDKGPR